MNYIENAVALRRELHQIPELGWGEFCTTARIIEELDRLGWKAFLVRTAFLLPFGLAIIVPPSSIGI